MSTDRTDRTERADRVEGRSAQETDVLIVGAGPAGLVAAISLARLGVSSVVVDQRSGPSQLPRATALGPRTMEIMRGWSLERCLREHELDVLPLGRVAGGPTSNDSSVVSLGLPSYDDARRVSPTAPALVPQDAVEQVLLDHLTTYSPDVRFGTRLVSLVQDERGVTATLRPGTARRRVRLRARFAIGADGANSLVRTRLGIAMSGQEMFGDFVAAHVRAPLAQVLGRPGFAMTTVHGSPGAAGATVFVPTDNVDRWLVVRRWDPAAGQGGDHTRGRMAELVRSAAGAPDLPVDVYGVQVHSSAAQVADRFQDGRVFLVGDAAHRGPVFGGGLDGAVSDADNLAWKLAFVLNGWAGPELLSTYEAERRPAAELFVSQPDRWLAPAIADPLAVDLGVTYREGAFVGDRTAVGVAVGGRTVAGGTGPWQQSARPGARAPHLWLGRDCDRVSTLDLFGDGLTVLTGSDGASWRHAACELATSTGLPLRTVSIGGSHGLRDVRGEFAALYGVEPDGAVLVRPDGYVAWRAVSTAEVDVMAELHRGVRAAVGTPDVVRRRIRSVA